MTERDTAVVVLDLLAGAAVPTHDRGADKYLVLGG